MKFGCTTSTNLSLSCCATSLPFTTFPLWPQLIVECPSDSLFRISEVICSPGTSYLLFYEILTNNSDMLLSSHNFLVITIQQGSWHIRIASLFSNEFITMHSGLFSCLRMFPKRRCIYVPLKYFPQTALLVGLNVSLHRSPQRTDVGHMTEHTVHRRQKS